jgi:hypothetical protein
MNEQSERCARLASELDRIVQELDEVGLNIAAAHAAQAAHGVRTALDKGDRRPVCKPGAN